MIQRKRGRPPKVKRRGAPSKSNAKKLNIYKGSTIPVQRAVNKANYNHRKYVNLSEQLDKERINHKQCIQNKNKIIESQRNRSEYMEDQIVSALDGNA